MSDIIPSIATSPEFAGRVRVKPQSIESELEKIRTAAANVDAEQEAAEKGSAAPRIRVTLSNLIIVRSDLTGLASAKAVDYLVNEICFAHPSRVFVIDSALKDATDIEKLGIATAVSSRCMLAESGAHVCSEEIYISIKEANVKLVANLLLALLVPGVDVVGIILGDVSKQESQLLEAACKHCDTLIYDSSSFSDYSASLRLASSIGTSARLTDLTWLRLKRWRNLIAEGFEAEALSGADSAIKKVVVSCNSDLIQGKIPADVLLLSGWMMLSLGAKPEKCTSSDSGLSISSSSGITLEIVSNKHSTDKLPPQESISAVSFIGTSGNEQIEFKLERTAAISSAVLSLKVGSNGTSARTAPFLQVATHDLLLSEIVSHAEDMAFSAAQERSLQLISKIATRP